MTALSLAHARMLVAEIPDPEIPAVTLADLGILRSTELDDDFLVVTLTPTYSGCPATEAIKADVRSVLTKAGYAKNRVQIALSPAWTTDWITDEGREKLRQYGIAPPNKAAVNSEDRCLVSTGRSSIRLLSANSEFTPIVFQAPDRGIQCPQCSSKNTEKLSQFGSTPCKALYRCIACREPFDYFKPY